MCSTSTSRQTCIGQRRISIKWRKWVLSGRSNHGRQQSLGISSSYGAQAVWGWWPCSDYRCLNDATTTDRYPIPHIHDFSSMLDGCCFFPKIDLVRGYHQIVMAQDDIQKTAIITPFGLFEFLRMPFGPKCAAQSFQRLMDTVCHELKFVFVHLDDILIGDWR